MKAVSQFLNYLLPVLYLAVLYIYYQIFFGKKKNWENKTGFMLTGLLALHACEITLRHIALNVMPLSTVYDALSFLAFSIVLIYLIIEISAKNKASGFFILCFANAVELVSAANFSWEPETNPLLINPAFITHASLTITGYTALALSAIYALMYILRKHSIKYHSFGVIYDQLPALTYLEFMSIRSTAVGILLLFLGILLGHIQAHRVFGTFWVTDIKVVVTDLIWLLYFTGYLTSRLFQWRGRWMAYLSISGFLMLSFGAFIMMAWGTSFHHFL